MKATEATDIIIIDETEACPYLEGKTARMPLRMPLERIKPHQIDKRLAEGDRRTGEFIYQTNCPTCSACQAIRVNCFDYQFSRNQRRRISRGDQKFTQEIGPLRSDPDRLSLFNRHRRQRGLAKRDADIDADEYVWGFVRSCFDSFEITYWLEDQLVCLAVCDQGETALSAVYTFFDPELPSDSLGTYSILKQIQLCKQKNLKFLYLGYYVAGSRHMEYKSRFAPNERLIDGRWVEFKNVGDDS